MATEYAGSVAQVHDAFCNEQYWLARLAESGADEVTLDAFRVGSDGGVDVMTTQVLRADRLPGVVHQFHRGDLEIRRAETWTAVTDGAAVANVASSITRAPVSLSGDALLTAFEAPAAGRSRLALRATVEVRIPLVGGKMEKFIGTQLMNLLSAEQQFTTRWIADNC